MEFCPDTQPGGALACALGGSDFPVGWPRGQRDGACGWPSTVALGVVTRCPVWAWLPCPWAGLCLPSHTCPGLGQMLTRHLLSQMPRRGGGSGNRRNQNVSSGRTARPPRACPQPCCHLYHRCRRRPPQRPHHLLSTLCPGSLAPSLRCPAHRSVACGGAASAPCSEAPQQFPGPTVEAPRMFSACSMIRAAQLAVSGGEHMGPHLPDLTALGRTPRLPGDARCPPLLTGAIVQAALGVPLQRPSSLAAPPDSRLPVTCPQAAVGPPRQAPRPRPPNTKPRLAPSTT